MLQEDQVVQLVLGEDVDLIELLLRAEPDLLEVLLEDGVNNILGLSCSPDGFDVLGLEDDALELVYLCEGLLWLELLRVSD